MHVMATTLFAAFFILFKVTIDCRIVSSSPTMMTDFTYETSVVYEDRRYRVSKQKFNYGQARKQCKKDNSTLAVIDSEEVSKAIITALESSSFGGATYLNENFTSDSIWIGLRLNSLNRVMGKWANGLIYDSDTSYANWAPDEPQTDKCVQLWKAAYWQWDDTYCDLERYFICEDKDPQSYTSTQVDILKKEILELAELNITTGVDLNVLSRDVNIILDAAPHNPSNLTEVQSQNITTRDILLAIEKITSNYNATWENYSVNRENVKIDSRGLGYPNDQVMLGEEINGTTDSAMSSIILSMDLLNEARDRAGNDDIQVNSVLYRNPSLFVSSAHLQEGTDGQESLFGEGPLRQKRSPILGNVIAVDVENVEMVNLKSPVTINHLVSIPSQFQLNGTSFITSTNNSSLELSIGNDTSQTTRRVTALKCVFWDFKLNENTGGWSEEGCHLSSFSTNNQTINVTCLCDHMTNFGILLDTSEYYETNYLTYVTIAGCIISITCLLCTVITHLYFKQLRSKVPQQILVHICVSLVLLNGLFLLGIDRISQPEFCFIITILLHYSVLLSWSWMLVEGVFLFRTLALYKIGAGTGICFMWTATVLSYVGPGVIVGITAGLFTEIYQSERYCWLAPDVLLYSIVIPVAVVLVINICIFVIVMWSMTARTQQKFQNKLDLKKLSQTLRRAFSMTFVLGLPWIFGYAMLLSKDDNLKNIFSIIFVIFNAIQSFGIFFLYCVRQENIRTLWFSDAQKRYRRTIRRLRSTPKRRVRRRKFPSEIPQTPQTSEDNSKKSSTNCYSTTLPSSNILSSSRSLDNLIEQTTFKPLPPPKPQRLVQHTYVNIEY